MNVAKEVRPHPAVLYLDDGISKSVNARFRSLSSRPIDLWDSTFENHEVQAVMETGQEVTFNTYEDFTYFYSPHDDNSTVLGSFTVTQAQVLPSHPPPNHSESM